MSVAHVPASSTDPAAAVARRPAVDRPDRAQQTERPPRNDHAGKHSLRRLAHFPLGCLLISCLIHGWLGDHPLTIAALVGVTAYFFFCWTSLFHETVHQTLTGNKTLDVIFGHVVGTLVLVPYAVYRGSHMRHHAYLNTPEDWELWPYCDPSKPKWFRRAFAWFDLLVGVLGAPIAYGRIYFHKDSPLRPAERREAFWGYVAIALFWGTFYTFVAAFGLWHEVLVAWIAPWLLAGLIQTTRKFTEHLGMASFDPQEGTRTVLGRGWITRLTTWLNFDIFVHGPHHRYPKMSHDKLAAVAVQAREEGEAGPTFDTYFAAIRDMLPSLLFNPGCGVNAGGEWPPPQAAAKLSRVPR